jgi:hypothetical protein
MITPTPAIRGKTTIAHALLLALGLFAAALLGA